jgi:hypothetical protein
MLIDFIQTGKNFKGGINLVLRDDQLLTYIGYYNPGIN